MAETTCHIHYHSGTGNTRRVAEWAAEVCEANGEVVRFHPIDKRNRRKVAKPAAHDRMVVAMPTHSFTTPWPVLKHLAGLPPGNGAEALVLCTRAGFRIGRFYGFGVEGTAWLFASLILLMKGYRPQGARGVDMPSNWIQAHPGFPRRTALLISEHGREQVMDFADKTILQGKTHWLTPMNIFQLLLGILLLPIAAAYLLVGRFMLGKILYADASCTHCGACAASCPADAIRLRGRERHPWWTYRCTNCMRCLSICPTQAVQTCHGWLALLIVLILLPVPALFARATGLTWADGPLGGLLYVWLLLFTAYPLLYLISRSKAGCRVLRAMSLTALWRRYLEPETTAEDLAADHARDDE